MVALNPAYAPVESTSRTQNRVGNFFVGSGDRAGLEPPGNRLGIGEKYDAAIRMVSGHSKFANGSDTVAMEHTMKNDEGFWSYIFSTEYVRDVTWQASYNARGFFVAIYRTPGTVWEGLTGLDDLVSDGIVIGQIAFENPGIVGDAIVGQGRDIIDGLDAILQDPQSAGELTGGVMAAPVLGGGIRMIYKGTEFGVGTSGARIAPFGNRTGHSTGRFPHYHRRALDSTGNVKPGGSLKRHRPWDKRSTDKSWKDRF